MNRNAITCGREVGSLAGTGFRVSDVRYGAGDTYDRHAHEHAYLVLVCSGGFAEDARNASVELTSGDVLVVPAGHAHRDVIAAHGARGLLVTIAPSFAAVPRHWRAHRGGPVSRSMIALHRELSGAANGETLPIEEQILTALSDDTPAEPIDHRAVRMARDLLETHCAQPLRLGDVAREVGVTAAYLARAFGRAERRTMGAYLRATRARRAAALLASTDDALADIAAATGFADQSHLSRVFAAAYTMTPQRYRDLMRRSKPFKT
ncbi:MAG TPA: AraC family transcriptional regulator [Thermoanaerobaculia bacterium]|nr:AraC family transcriptional regulator [Thermoanaerobaculia bacterium]